MKYTIAGLLAAVITTAAVVECSTISTRSWPDGVLAQGYDQDYEDWYAARYNFKLFPLPVEEINPNSVNRLVHAGQQFSTLPSDIISSSLDDPATIGLGISAKTYACVAVVPDPNYPSIYVNRTEGWFTSTGGPDGTIGNCYYADGSSPVFAVLEGNGYWDLDNYPDLIEGTNFCEVAGIDSSGVRRYFIGSNEYLQKSVCNVGGGVNLTQFTPRYAGLRVGN